MGGTLGRTDELRSFKEGIAHQRRMINRLLGEIMALTARLVDHQLCAILPVLVRVLVDAGYRFRSMPASYAGTCGATVPVDVVKGVGIGASNLDSFFSTVVGASHGPVDVVH